MQDITVFGKYFDIFWSTISPIGKKAVAGCTHCKKIISQRDFSPKLKNAYQELKVKTPLKHWFYLFWLEYHNSSFYIYYHCNFWT